MQYLWSKLSSVKWLDAWEERFHGDCRAVIEELKGGKTIRLQVYTQNEEEARLIETQFGGTVRAVQSRDWEAPQELRQKPLLIRNKLVITQRVNGEAVEALREAYPQRTILNIPAEMAFGTGDHATTATCLRFLVDYAGARKKKGKEERKWSMLDVGCGTGVLALAAHHLGAQPVEAFDFDQKAVEVAIKNCQHNGATDLEPYGADIFDWPVRRRYDFVAANLFSTVLQKAFPIFAAALAPDGVLLISGILSEQWPETARSGEKAGFLFYQVQQKGKWVTALASR